MDSNHFPKNEKIGFLRKTTLVDFPEHIACAVFLIGCNLRCPYCYNKDLVLINENSQKIVQEQVNPIQSFAQDNDIPFSIIE